jgi:hypothetical protein
MPLRPCAYCIGIAPVDDSLGRSIPRCGNDDGVVTLRTGDISRFDRHHELLSWRHTAAFPLKTFEL